MNFTIVSITKIVVPLTTKILRHRIIPVISTLPKIQVSHLRFSTMPKMPRTPIDKNLSSVRGIHENISSLQMKKRLVRKKKPSISEDAKPEGVYTVVAYATAEEYQLEQLIDGLMKEDLYVPKKITSSQNDGLVDVVYATAKYEVTSEPRDIFFFREGSVVFWNCTELETCNVLTFVKKYEMDSYGEKLVIQESEAMDYRYEPEGKTQIKGGEFVFSSESQDTQYEKYTFSNAMALSVKLGMWEASLEKYIESISYVTDDLKNGNKIRMNQDEVLRKHGELFALRHLINLSSDLLDTPDFYWDREQLEALYSQTCNYFSIPRRTKIVNEKINHCVELIELLRSHLANKHGVMLEWMVIVLIMVEVGFEILHLAERLF